jgi:hypothetical protein
MKIWRRFVIGLVILAGIGILRVPILRAVTAVPNFAYHILNDSNVIINGTASATTAKPNGSFYALDDTNHIINSFGGGSGGLATTAPTWMQNPAGGFETDPNNSVTLQGHHRYASTFTIPVGKTLTIARDLTYPDGFGPAAALWIEAPSCVIAGTIDGHALLPAESWFGASGGGGGGDAAVNAGFAGADSCSSTSPPAVAVVPVSPGTACASTSNQVVQSVGGAFGAAGVAGTVGAVMTAASKNYLYGLGSSLFSGAGYRDIGGAGGGSNFAQNLAIAEGGGALFLSCTTIDFQSTAVANMSGQAGPAFDAPATGGYGGAAGGIAWFAAHTYTHSPATTGTVNVAGGAAGAGGVGAGAGGVGGAGDKEVFTY